MCVNAMLPILSCFCLFVLDYVSNKGESLFNLLAARDEDFPMLVTNDEAIEAGGNVVHWDADDLINSPVLAKTVGYTRLVAKDMHKHSHTKKCTGGKNVVGTISVANTKNMVDVAEKEMANITQYPDSSRTYSPDCFQNKMSIESSGYWSSESPRSEEPAASHNMEISSLNKSMRKENFQSQRNNRIPADEADHSKVQEFGGEINRQEASELCEECLIGMSSDQTIRKVISFQNEFVSSAPSQEVPIEFSDDSLENDQVSI